VKASQPAGTNGGATGGMVIVGALGTIGRPLAAAIARQQSQLLIVDVDSAQINSLEESLRFLGGPQIYSMTLNPSERDPGLELVNYLVHHEISFNHLVNAAYPGKQLLSNRPGGLGEQQSWGKFVGEHVGFFLSLSTHFAEYAARSGGGSITNLSSMYGRMSPKFRIYEETGLSLPIEYGAAKAGVENLSQYLASRYLAKGVRVNCVAPGGILADQPQLFQENYGRETGRGALLKSEEIIGAILLLLSPAGRAITGQTITVDDGFSLT